MWLTIAAAVCGLIAFGIYGQAAQNRALDDQTNMLAAQNAALHHQIADRQREIVEAQTSAWLVEEARKMGYVFPWEKVFVVTPSGQPAPKSGGVNAPLPSFSPLPTSTPSPSASPTTRPSPTAVPLTVGSPPPSPH